MCPRGPSPFGTSQPRSNRVTETCIIIFVLPPRGDWKQDLALRASNMTTALRKPPLGCLNHIDRGAQYRGPEYQKRLRKHD